MKLLAAAGFFAALSFSQLSSAATLWSSCNQCTATQRQQTALTLTAPNSYQYIYVVDNTRREVSKFETFSEIEPGSQSLVANALPTEAAVLTASRTVWTTADTIKSGIQLPAIPACSAGGHDGAVNYIGNDLNCQQALRSALENQGVFGQMRQGFAVLLNQIAAYFGTQRQMMAVVRFADGSSLKLQVTLGQDVNTGQVSILCMKVIEATNSYGDPLPVSATQAQTLNITTRVGGVGDLEYLLANRFGFMILRRICSYSQGGASCSPQGGQIVCEVRGTVGC